MANADFGVANTDSLVETTFLDGNRNLVGLQKNSTRFDSKIIIFSIIFIYLPQRLLKDTFKIYNIS